MDGRVTLVKWGRPHVEVYIDVTDRQGKTVNWDIQLNPPNFLLDHGWKVDSLKPGMDVCVEGFPEKNGQRRFGSSSITLKATGQILKTPAGVWLWPTGQLAGEVPYTGTPSCSSRVSR